MDFEQVISEETGFDRGDKFTSADDVRAYFTLESQRMMFGDDAVQNQEVLDVYAQAVIDNGWHCTDFGIDVNLTERQIRGIHNLLDTGHRVGFRAVVGRHPAELLSEPEMVDLQVRLIRALGEKQS